MKRGRNKKGINIIGEDTNKKEISKSNKQRTKQADGANLLRGTVTGSNCLPGHCNIQGDAF
jgi:hypothetical protein